MKRLAQTQKVTRAAPFGIGRELQGLVEDGIHRNPLSTAAHCIPSSWLAQRKDGPLVQTEPSSTILAGNGIRSLPPSVQLLGQFS